MVDSSKFLNYASPFNTCIYIFFQPIISTSDARFGETAWVPLINRLRNNSVPSSWSEKRSRSPTLISNKTLWLQLRPFSMVACAFKLRQKSSSFSSKIYLVFELRFNFDLDFFFICNFDCCKTSLCKRKLLSKTCYAIIINFIHWCR